MRLSMKDDVEGPNHHPWKNSGYEKRVGATQGKKVISLDSLENSKDSLYSLEGRCNVNCLYFIQIVSKDVTVPRYLVGSTLSLSAFNYLSLIRSLPYNVPERFLLTKYCFLFKMIRVFKG